MASPNAFQPMDSFTAAGKPKTGGRKISPAVAAVHAFLRPVVQKYIDSGRPVDSVGGIRGGLTKNELKALKKDIDGVLKANGVVLSSRQLSRRYTEYIDQVTGTFSKRHLKESADPEKYKKQQERNREAYHNLSAEEKGKFWRDKTDAEKARLLEYRRNYERKKSDDAAKKAAAAIPRKFPVPHFSTVSFVSYTCSFMSVLHLRQKPRCRES